MDPIADKFAFVSAYNYAENSPISNIDLHGLQAVLSVNGRLIGYKVKEGQGPTQIAEDLNENHSSRINGQMSWLSIVLENKDKFQNVDDGEGLLHDKNNEDFKFGNIEPGEILNISDGFEGIDEIIEINKVAIKAIEDKADSLTGVKNETEKKIEVGENTLGPAPGDPKTGGSASKLIIQQNRKSKLKELEKDINSLQQKADSIKNFNKKLKKEN